MKFKGETPKQVTETTITTVKPVETERSVIEHKVTGFLQATAKQEIHHLVCLQIGKKLRIVDEKFPKSTDKQFVYGNKPFQHTFGVDSTQEPLFEDQKARPVYFSIIGSFGPAKVEGKIIQPIGNGTIPPANTDDIEITALTNQDSNVHNQAFEQGEMDSILAAGTRNALPNQNPVWMQFLAFGGPPAGFILGGILLPYITKALGGG